MFQKRAETPVEKRNYSTFYLVFSGLLFLSTLWAVVDEVVVRRPWKAYQSEYYKLSEEKVAAQYADALAAVDSSAAADITAALPKQRKNLRARNISTL